LVQRASSLRDYVVDKCAHIASKQEARAQTPIVVIYTFDRDEPLRPDGLSKYFD
jgi:hypothetical protein